MASCVRPEEVYISILIHFFVHPPPVELLPAPDRRTIARQLAVFLLKELKEPDSVVYPTLAQLCTKLRTKLGELGNALVRCLETTLLNLRSTHDVYKLFALLEKLLVRKNDVRAQPQGGRVVAGLDPLSPLGLFVRKQRLAFLAMSFEAMAQLFTAIVEDVSAEMEPGGCFAPLQGAAAGQGAMASLGSAANGGAGGGPEREAEPQRERARGEAGLGAGGRVGGGGALRERAALETYVSRLMQRIELLGPSLPQAELDAALDALERLSAGQCGAGGAGGADERVPLARLLRLQAALQHRDYTAALDLLHSYYNCMAPGPAGRNRNASGLLNLSQLHAGLGHTSAALQALNETMRLAQHCGDPVALLHALSVLCRLLAASAPGAPGLPPHGPAALRSSQAHHVQLLRMLRRCGERGRELGQPQLVAFAQLAAARFALMHDVEPSDSGLHAPPGSLTAAPPATAAAAGAAGGAGTDPSATTAAEAALGGSGGELRSAPIMVAAALRDTLALATAASLSAAAPAAPPPAPTDGTPPPQRPGAAASDLYSSPLLFDRSVPQGAAVAIADAVQQLGGAAHLLQAAAWALHGHSTLERIHTMMYLAAYSDPRVGCGAPARFEDRSTACAQLVSAAARRGPAAAKAAAAACLALLSAPLTDEGAPVAAAPRASAVDSNGAEGADREGAGRSGGSCSGLALWGGPALAAAWLCAAHDRALAVGDSAAAAQLVAQLGALADPQPHRDVDLRLEAARRGVLNLMAAGSTSAAQQAATELFARCADAGLHAPPLRCLLLLAEVHLTAGDPHGAFPHVLACLLPAQPGPGPGGGAAGGAEASSLGAAVAGAAGSGAGGGGGSGGRSHDLLAAEALVLLCRVWHELSDGQQLEEVLVLLQDALPLILAHGCVALQARTQLTLAEMVMSEAHSPADLVHCYCQLQRLLSGAVEAAIAAEDFRLAALAACLLAWLHEGQGATAERDEAAALHEALLVRQADMEAACAAEGRVLEAGPPEAVAAAGVLGAA